MMVTNRWLRLFASLTAMTLVAIADPEYVWTPSVR
jgi:hypothetical protein